MNTTVTIATAVLSTMGASGVIAALLPRPAAGTRLEAVFKILDALAGNYLNARNAGK